MSLLADALQPLIVPELFTRRAGLSIRGIADLLVAPRAAYIVDFDVATGRLGIDFGDSAPVVEALAATISRMACASFQTINAAVMESLEREALPWGLVKIYYAAFYAGHAIISVLGEACSYFDSTHTKKLRELAVAVGAAPTTSIAKGLYRATAEDPPSRLQCASIGNSAGGTHEQFWDVFGKRMSQASQDVLSGPLPIADAQAVFAKLDAMSVIIRRFGTFSWLSKIRNDVQYRHEHDVWFPKGLTARRRESLSRIAEHWNRDPMNIHLSPGPHTYDNVLRDFVTVSIFIIAVCHALLRKIADRSSVGSRSFVQQGPMVFLNLFGAPPATSQEDYR